MVIGMARLKRCSSCGGEKPATLEFYQSDRRNADGMSYRCKACDAEKRKSWLEKNRAQNANRAREWYKKNKERHIECGRSYYHSTKKHCQQFKIRNSVKKRVREALSGGGKSSPLIKLLGCSIGEYRDYLERLFLPGMSWGNRADWHIDHIIPLSSFDLTCPGQQAIAFHFENTRPLWAADNLRKGAKLPSCTVR